jgi:hypothetical protein
MSKLISRHAIAVLVTSTAMASIALATASAADAGTLYACVKRNGQARIFSRRPRCPKGQTRLAWNTTGPAGPKGATGRSGKNGAAGKNGTAGQNGKAGETGKEGSPGQPQSVTGFSGSLLGTISDPFHTTETRTTPTLVSLAGVTVRMKCEFKETEGFVGRLEALAPGGQVYAGVIASPATGGLLNDPEPSVYDKPMTPTGTSFAVLNAIAPANAELGYVKSFMALTGSVVMLDAVFEVGSVGGTVGCAVSGVAYAIPG